MTLAIDHAGATPRERRSRAAEGVKWQSRSFRLFLAGLVALLVSAWGGIVAFVGPTFGFSADGTQSWYWSLSHALLALVPGAVGVVVGLALMGYSRSRSRTYLGLGAIGLLAVLAGGWFAIGPLAWPVLYGSRAYFVGASPLRELTYVVGYALGPGLILAVIGGVAWGSETATASGSVDGTGEYAPPSNVGAVRPVPVPSVPEAFPVAPEQSAPTEASGAVREVAPVPQAAPDQAPGGTAVMEDEGGPARDTTDSPGGSAPDGGTMPE
jgi:hypothetical protein